MSQQLGTSSFSLANNKFKVSFFMRDADVAVVRSVNILNGPVLSRELLSLADARKKYSFYKHKLGYKVAL
jgi:hypothetical protein